MGSQRVGHDWATELDWTNSHLPPLSILSTNPFSGSLSSLLSLDPLLAWPSQHSHPHCHTYASDPHTKLLAQNSNLHSADIHVNVIQENQTQDSKDFSGNSSHTSFPQKPDPLPESSTWVKKILLFSVTLSPTLGSYSFVSLSGPMCYEPHQFCLFWNAL